MELSPYLMFKGNCEEALKFYEATFGAKIEDIHRYAGSPAEEHAPPDWGDKVMHARVIVGNTVMMASDAAPEHYSAPQGISIALGLNDTAKGEEIFSKLSEDGTVQMPFQSTFWAKGFGMCIDRFGIPWMVNCE